MKRTFVKALALTLIVVMMLCTFAGCGKKVEAGSYSGELEMLGQSWKVTYTFKGNKVEAENKITFLGKVNTVTSTGTYELVENDDGTMEITFEFEKESDTFKNGTVTFEQGEDYIKLAGVQYNLAD